MSEFSESYHLKTSETEHGIELLSRAGLRGFVFPATNGWVTVLPEGEPFAPNEPLIKASTGTLFYFGNAEDHGWWFAVYVDANPIASYTCSWEDSIQVFKFNNHLISKLSRKSLGRFLLRSEAKRSDRYLNPKTSKSSLRSSQPTY